MEERIISKNPVENSEAIMVAIGGPKTAQQVRAREQSLAIISDSLSSLFRDDILKGSEFMPILYNDN